MTTMITVMQEELKICLKQSQHFDEACMCVIDTSCEAIKHQSTIAKFGDSWEKKGIGNTPDPFGAGAYNLQSISALR